MMKHGIILPLGLGGCRAWLLLMLILVMAVVGDVKLLAAEDQTIPFRNSLNLR